MTEQSNYSYDDFYEMLKEVHESWTDISYDENDEKIHYPASKDELINSRNRLNEIWEYGFDDEALVNYYQSLVNVLDEYEETQAYSKTPNEQADNLQDQIFSLWTNISHEDDIEYRSPATIEEVENSWQLIKQIEKIDFDDENIKTRLQTQREILEEFKTTTAKEDDIKAWEKLGEVYGSWSNISYDEEQEYRSPYNRKEIKSSRSKLSKIKSFNITDPEVVDRLEELENVVDSTDSAMPRHTSRVIKSLIFSGIFLFGLFYYLTFNPYSTPEIDYDKEWYVTEKGGYILWKPFISDKELPEEKQKVYVKKGTQLKPIAEIGGWLQVETPSGQRGLMDATLLKGSRFMESKSQALLTKKIEGNVTDTIPKGIKATVLERTKRKGRFGDETFLKIKLDDGKIRWAHEYNFKNLIYTNIPKIEQLYRHTTNKSMADKQIIGKPLMEIEDFYGPPLSVLKVNDKNQVYYRYLVIVDDDLFHKGILINLDDNDVATGIEYINGGEERTYDIFPLVSTFRDFEFNQIERLPYYRRDKIEITWWEDFKSMNWFTKIISWIVGIILLILGFFLFFSIPRIVISPIMQFFMFNKSFHNGRVLLFNSIIYLIAIYLFFVIVVNMLDQWLIPAVGSLVVGFIWMAKHFKNISYNRCPACATMYSALDEGSTFTGQQKNVTWGTHDVYKGTTETSTTITRNYERRDTKTTETIDSYLDHRMCALCHYEWDVDRDETSEETEHY